MDTLETTRRKLRFRSSRRGTKESDIVMGGFVKTNIDNLNAKQLVWLEALLDQNDQDVLSWIIGMVAPPSAFDTEVLHMLKSFKKSL